MARSWTSTRRPEAAGHRESVFSTKGEAVTKGVPPSHHGVEALVSSDAALVTARGAALGAACAATLGAACAATVYTNGPERRRKTVFANLCTLLSPPASPPASRAGLAPQQCTQMAQNGVEGTFSAICVHYCVPTGRPRGPRAAALGTTVYTNAPERRREDVFGDLCTLLRNHGVPACPSHRSSRRNSVHKCPGTASRGRFRRSVYTIASPCVPTAARVTLASQQCTQMPQNGSEETFSPICVHYCVTRGRPRDPRASTVYTNAPERLREAVFGDLCTLLRPPASPPAARAGLAAQQCTQSRSP